MGGVGVIMFGSSFFLFWFASHSLFFLERVVREPSLLGLVAILLLILLLDIVSIFIEQLTIKNQFSFY